MPSVVTSFNYIVEASFVIDDVYYDIPDGSINSIIIDYSYDTKNMPGMYVALRLTTDLYNKMVLNQENGLLSFRLYKYNTQVSTPVKEPYVEDRFIYIIQSDPNYNVALDKQTSNEDNSYLDNPNSYMSGHIGLLSLKLIEQNSVLINDIIKNSNMASIVHKYTNHMKMCIEPFDNNKMIDQFIIPPINTITGLLSYLNNNYCFYKSGYRYFRDFNKTYLLSMKGNPVKDDEYDYQNIIISVRDPLDDLANSASIELDPTNKAYIIYVNANNVSIAENRTAAKKYNTVMSIDTVGNTKELELDIPMYAECSKKYIFERIPESNNEELPYNTKTTLESGSFAISVVKNEIDTSLISPNKQFYIKSHDLNRGYDGKYVLASKKEIYYRNDASFICTVNFILRRAEKEE